MAASGTGNIPAFDATNNSNEALTATITVYPKIVNNNYNCDGISQSFKITILPEVEVNVIQDYTLCNKQIFDSLKFTTNNTDGNTRYEWTNTNSEIVIASSGTDYIPSFYAKNNTDSTINATISVTSTYNYLGNIIRSIPMIFTFNVKPTPVAVIKGDAK